MTSYLTEKRNKLRSFVRQWRRSQNCPFQSSFTQNCAVHSGNPTVSSVYLPTPLCHTQKKTHRTDKKTDKPGGKPVLCQRTFSSVFREVFYTVKLHSLTFFVIKPTRYTDFTNLFWHKLYMFRTVRLSIIKSLFTVHSAMVYVTQVSRQ
jgi:hypothetical protein